MITIKTENLKTNTEVINREIYPEEVVDDMVNAIRASKIPGVKESRVKAFDAYIERKEMEVEEFENEYFQYKREILNSGISQELAFEKLEFMFDRLLEEKEDLQILKNYRIVS